MKEQHLSNAIISSGLQNNCEQQKSKLEQLLLDPPGLFAFHYTRIYHTGN